MSIYEKKVIVRDFNVDDIEHVLKLLQDVSVYYPDVDSALEIANSFIKNKETYSVVATLDRMVVGFGSIFILKRIRGGKSAIIEDMVVSANYRGLGIGKTILEELLSFARMMGCFKISLESSKEAEKFYKASGFSYGGYAMKYYL